MADAVGGDRIAVLAVVPVRELQHALAPGIGIGFLVQLFRTRAVQLDHLLDFPLELRGVLGLGGAAGNQEQEQRQGKRFGQRSHGHLRSMVVGERTASGG
jgi:hypothetical protein